MHENIRALFSDGGGDFLKAPRIPPQTILYYLSRGCNFMSPKIREAFSRKKLKIYGKFLFPKTNLEFVIYKLFLSAKLFLYAKKDLP